jgi:hypothetical protein
MSERSSHARHPDGIPYGRCEAQMSARRSRTPARPQPARGSTWYELDLAPQAYWSIWSDLLVHRIHRRVLEHIRRETLDL